MKKLLMFVLPFVVVGALMAADASVTDKNPPPENTEISPAKNTSPPSGKKAASYSGDYALTGDQMVQIVKSSMEHQGFAHMLLPIVAIIVTFGFPVAIIAIILISKASRDRRLHETLRAMIEKGVPIPPEFFKSGLDSQCHERSDLRSGLVQVSVGLGLMLMMYLLPHCARFWPVGLVPLFIGIARLISWKIEKKIPEQDK